MDREKIKLFSYTLFIIAASVGVAALIMSATNGSIIYTDNNLGIYANTVLSCTSPSVNYPFFTYDDSESRELSIDVIFSDKILNAISLKYILYYSDQDKISKSQATNHAAMDISFYSSGLGANSFDAVYSILNDSMRMTLYATKNIFNRSAAQYFMIDVPDEAPVPQSIDEFEAIYKKGGLNCTIKD